MGLERWSSAPAIYEQAVVKSERLSRVNVGPLGCHLERDRAMGSMPKASKALLAELLLAGLLLGYGWFSVYRLVLLLLLASQSLWVRGLGWADLGLARPRVVWRAVVQGAVAAAAILAAVRVVIVPLAVRVTGAAVDLSAMEDIRGDASALWPWLAQAWTLAAFGEEMVFRGYLIGRVADLAGHSRIGAAAGLLVSSVFFGWAHRYLGPAGMLATGCMGALLGLLYIATRNLWPVIICHALVDTVSLLVVYSGHGSWLFP